RPRSWLARRRRLVLILIDLLVTLGVHARGEARLDSTAQDDVGGRHRPPLAAGEQPRQPRPQTQNRMHEPAKREPAAVSIVLASFCRLLVVLCIVIGVHIAPQQAAGESDCEGSRGAE